VALQQPEETAMNTTAPRTLSRSINDRMIAGVMGGIAHRFGWNVTLLRILFVVVSLASAAFPCILVYLLLWLLIPNEAD
jgi:phage shock protein C